MNWIKDRSNHRKRLAFLGISLVLYSLGLCLLLNQAQEDILAAADKWSEDFDTSALKAVSISFWMTVIVSFVFWATFRFAQRPRLFLKRPHS